MKSRPFRLMAVGEDRKILRRLTRFLSAFGFEVDPVTNVRQAIAACKVTPPDFLIVDADSLNLEQGRQLFAPNHKGHPYTFLMLREAQPQRLTDAMMAGVDDFLAKPLVFGELLARLRAGARVVEYDRRVREQSAVDSVTGLLSASAFRERVQSELNASDDHEVSCVLLDIDYLDQMKQWHGCTICEEVLRAVANQVRSVSGECKYLARVGDGRLAALLPNASDAQALAWAETVRQAVAHLEVPLKHETISVTASLGVAGIMQGVTSAEELIHRAEDAVRMARSSGRNCVSRCGQFDGETREWEDLARQGRLFENTVARDVMVPCPQFALGDQDIREVAEILEQSRLNELPVVDRQGRLLGMFAVDQVPEHVHRGNKSAKVCEHMRHDVATVPEQESFGALMQFFMTEDPQHHVVVVVRHDKPLGVIYRSGLAALSEPLHVDSFSPDQDYSPSSAYLVVSDAD